MRLRLVEYGSQDYRGTYQINMFEDTTELLSLYQAMTKLKQVCFDAVSMISTIIKQKQSKIIYFVRFARSGLMGVSRRKGGSRCTLSLFR
jgi:hypothetical protein